MAGKLHFCASRFQNVLGRGNTVTALVHPKNLCEAQTNHLLKLKATAMPEGDPYESLLTNEV